MVIVKMIANGSNKVKLVITSTMSIRHNGLHFCLLFKEYTNTIELSMQKKNDVNVPIYCVSSFAVFFTPRRGKRFA